MSEPQKLLSALTGGLSFFGASPPRVGVCRVRLVESGVSLSSAFAAVAAYVFGASVHGPVYVVVA